VFSDLADVSLPKVVIHKHGGKISVAKDEARRITITISLPTGWSGTSQPRIK
jgi:signal transduction histidine kinase